MSKIIKETFILFAITLVAGLGLGFVYNVTSDARLKQEEKTKLEAFEAVMPGMDSFEEISFKADEVNKYVSDKIAETEKNDKTTTIKPYNAEVNQVVKAIDKSGNELGYIVTITDKEAYGGSLQMTVGITTDKTVKGISYLSLSETPGLGMRASEDEFKNQFSDKSVDYFKYVKTGAASDNEIDALSGATITTNAVTHGVNGAIFCVDYLMGGDK